MRRALVQTAPPAALKNKYGYLAILAELFTIHRNPRLHGAVKHILFQRGAREMKALG